MEYYAFKIVDLLCIDRAYGPLKLGMMVTIIQTDNLTRPVTEHLPNFLDAFPLQKH